MSQKSTLYRLTLRLSGFVPLVLLVVWVNWKFDPSSPGAFCEDEQRAVECLVRGEPYYARSLEERTVQISYLERRTQAPEILVFGSSRVMQIHEEMFPGYDLYNLGVTGGCLQDKVALFQLCHEKRLEPKVVILGIDPWDFNVNYSDRRWQLYLQDAWTRSLARLGVESPTRLESPAIKETVDLVSPSHLQRSLKMLVRRLERQPRLPQVIVDPAQAPADYHKRCVDGSLQYSRQDSLRTPEEVTSNVQELVENGQLISRMERYHELDEHLVQVFEAFVRDLRSRDIQVILYLPPYHPLAYEAMEQSPQFRMLPVVENYLRRVAEEQQLELLSSYDGSRLHVSPEGFIDAGHLTHAAMRRNFELMNCSLLTTRLASRPPAAN